MAASTDLDQSAPQYAGTLRPGELIYLWPPNEEPAADNRIEARVQRATQDTILAVDQGTGVQGRYDVGYSPVTGLAHGAPWTWRRAPESARAGIEQVDVRCMTLMDRIRLILGEDGGQLRIGLRSGGQVVGTLRTVIVDGSDDVEGQWSLIEGPLDTRGVIHHWIRVSEIESITRIM